jgi:hypothetical protein
MNTVRQANGEIVTGKVWRQQHLYFHRLPFYSNIPRMDEMVVPLKMALAKVSGHERFCALLLVGCFICFVYFHIYLIPVEIGPGTG